MRRLDPRLVRVLSLAALIGFGLPGCGTQRGATASTDSVSVKADYFVSEFGIRVAMNVGFDQARRVTEATLRWDGGSDDVSLYPTDGSDPNAPPDFIDVPTGERALMEGTILTPCPMKISLPILEVVSSYDGSRHTDRYRPHDQAAFDHAFDQWCARPPAMNIRGSSMTPEGQYEVTLQFSNPGPRSIEVVSEEVEGGPSTWQRSTTVVQPGTLGQMTITGHGPPDCLATPPWASGHVFVDGVSLMPPDDDSWC